LNSTPEEEYTAERESLSEIFPFSIGRRSIEQPLQLLA
jgi:hypothetical protein